MFDPKKMKLKTVARLMNLYPPFLGAGIKVKLRDKLSFEISMPLNPMNRNYVGTQFGGSLYSMTDPFYMLILMNKLGREYLVWDKSAQIHFRSPGRGRVHAFFEIDDSRVEEIKKEVENKGKTEPVFHVDVVDDHGKIIAQVEKKLWVAKKVK